MSLSHEQKSLIEVIAEDFEDMSIDNLHNILPQLMIEANNYKSLDIEKKKKLIIKMLEHLVDITDGPGDDEIWDPVIKRLLPGMLDLLVETNKGKLVPKKKIFKWCC